MQLKKKKKAHLCPKTCHINRPGEKIFVKSRTYEPIDMLHQIVFENLAAKSVYFGVVSTASK